MELLIFMGFFALLAGVFTLWLTMIIVKCRLNWAFCF